MGPNTTSAAATKRRSKQQPPMRPKKSIGKIKNKDKKSKSDKSRSSKRSENKNKKKTAASAEKGVVKSENEVVQWPTPSQQLSFFIDQYQSANRVQLSTLELDSLKETSIVELRRGPAENITGDLGEHVKDAFGSSWKQKLCEKSLQEGQLDPGSPSLLVISSSALRSLELIRELRPLTKECHAAKLFSKHMKVEEQVSILKDRVNVASGTPNRIKKLIDMEALGLSRLAVIVLDMHTDVKGYSLFTLPQVSPDWLPRKSWQSPKVRVRVQLLGEALEVSPPAGFPDHPHRGFETVTYMLQGGITHQDFAGHKGTIHTGEVQWMTAGRGIVHSEMPAGEGPNLGLQLWINLSSKDKMIEPKYQELLNNDIPSSEKDGVEVKVIAGESMGVHSPVYTRTPTMYLDFTIKPNAQYHQTIPESWNSFVYIIEGEGVFGIPNSQPSPAHHILVLGPGDGLSVWNKSSDLLRFVLVGGQPINEPVVQHGPFVMNTQDEIDKTIEDYYYGKNGFEMARYWRSE
ncbi:hypothetical protein RD792_004920 [Penstemon davidsonii]|uniref:Pirin-like protein n=1 Tax=Penstemon davidsonii TaxID=160366 RepID=A0ABR0DJN3_9LAMI|nr:hypothetical protein RD792_004920 [Penstemon davidsonii]